MTRVVDKLDLDVDYLMPVSLHKVALYKNERPIEVLFHDSLPHEKSDSQKHDCESENQKTGSEHSGN